MKKQSQLTRCLLLGAVTASLLTGCGGVKTPNVTDPAGGTAPGTSTGGGGYQQPAGEHPSVLPQALPPDQAPQEPLDTPEPLPAPSNPVQPGQPMVLRAVSNTTAFAVPRFSKWFSINGTYVHVHLTWQPVSGAKEYWIYKDKLPDFKEANRETAHAVVQAGLARSGYKDGLEPPNLKSGSLWDRLKRAIGTVTNRPGQMYSYKVIAADGNGVAMSESPIMKTVPLPAVSSATMDPASDTNTRLPLFTWKEAQGGTRPNGYYVSVFPTVQFTGETIPPTSLAYWTTFRPAGTNVARYGQDNANLSSYAGSRPFDITFDLQPSKSYSWTVVGIMTDTGDMRTANAISRSWSGFGHFTIAANAPPVANKPAPVNAAGYSSYNTGYGYNTYNNSYNTGYNYNNGYTSTGYTNYNQSGYNYAQPSSSYGYGSSYGSTAYGQTGYGSSYGSSYGAGYGTSYDQNAYGTGYGQQTSYGSGYGTGYGQQTGYGTGYTDQYGNRY